MKDRRVGVLMGGPSSENEVSMDTGQGVLAGLLEASIDAHAVVWQDSDDIAEKLKEQKIEVVWNALHGTYGEDGAIQGLLACLKIPYTGSGIASSALAMDKVMSKVLFRHHDIPTADWYLPGIDPTPDWVKTSRVVVKPSQEGSSVGISLVSPGESLDDAIQAAAACGGAPMVEPFIEGDEVFVAILGEQTIGAVEVRPATEFYDYEAKYKRTDTEYLCPPQVNSDIMSKVNQIAWKAFKLLGCSCYGRTDIRVDQDGNPYVLEVNTLPGMTATSLLPKIAANAGMTYSELCVEILQMAHL